MAVYERNTTNLRHEILRTFYRNESQDPNSFMFKYSKHTQQHSTRRIETNGVYYMQRTKLSLCSFGKR